MKRHFGRILIIEDDPDVVAVLAFGLRGAGSITVAADGAEGLTLARSMRPDLILCDVMLPGMDGLRICAALRDENPGAPLPLIFITATAAVAFKTQRPEEFGALGVLAKPFDADTIAAKIGGLVGVSPLPPSPARALDEIQFLRQLEAFDEQLLRTAEDEDLGRTGDRNTPSVGRAARGRRTRPSVRER